MTTARHIDGVLVQWGDRLFYPANRIVKVAPAPRLNAAIKRRASAIRQRIAAVVRRAPQVMVKVTGGGRGMGAITAHFRYISRNGRLGMEDDRGVMRTGREAVSDLADQWRYGGTLIDEVGHRREAFNIMLSMPAGTDAGFVQKAAREFAHAELAGHRYVMVLHEHQANPHVHLSVRAESASGSRLNPRKSDLHRWRETFAEKLRGWGIDAEATRQASRGATRNYDPLWRISAKREWRLRKEMAPSKATAGSVASRSEAMMSWAQIMRALSASDVSEDRRLAERIGIFVRDTPFMVDHAAERAPDRAPPQSRSAASRELPGSRSDRDVSR